MLIDGNAVHRIVVASAPCLCWLKAGCRIRNFNAGVGNVPHQPESSMKTKFALRLVAAALFVLGLQPAMADDGQVLVRVRALRLDAANRDGTGLGLSINNKTFPEVDFSYFLSPNLAAELILTYPQKQTIYSNGSEIGSLKHLPPTLTLQYHVNPGGTVRPYIGAGINFTNFSGVEFAPAVQASLHPGIKHTSWGAAWQLGADIVLAKDVYLNVDVKKLSLGTTVYSNGASVGKFKVNPTLAGIGLGWRF